MDRVGICGIGFVGEAIMKSFTEKGVINLVCYDKYKNGGKELGTFESLLKTDILFLALPTIFDESIGTYDMGPIVETLNRLRDNNYNGVIVNKSTVEPTTTENLAKEYNLNLIHNPEFLTASTAYDDFHNQKHIVLGRTSVCHEDIFNMVEQFYKRLYPDAEITLCSSTESECMKIFVNCFYSVKIQFFNELYFVCDKIGTNYDNVRKMMLKNGWINPMHTMVPGTDGLFSYGGLCFPKDTNALYQFMQKINTPSKVLEGTILEREEMRSDHDNVKKIEK